MKVLMISEYFYPIGKGGGEISTFLLAKEVAKKGVEVHVLTSKFEELRTEEVINGVIIHRNLRSGKNPNSLVDNIKRRLFFEKSLLKELERLDKKEKFDIIHCMNASSISAVKLKYKLKKCFFLHANSPVLFCPKGTLIYNDRESCNRKCDRKTFFSCYMNSSMVGKMELNILMKYNPLVIYGIRSIYENNLKLIKKFDYYIGISGFMKKCLIRSGILEKKISVVHPIIELDRFRNLKQPKNKIPKILYLGEYSKPKGPHLILEALNGIKEEYKASFYGEGALKDFFIDEVKKNNLNVEINSKADYSNIPKILEDHDIVIIPSFVGEAFSRVALEACASGKTVIASRIGGIIDIVEDNKNGYLFNPGDIKDLEIKITKVLKNKIKATKIRESVVKKFSNEEIIRKVLKCYNAILEK